jgi:hypothetical protein
MKASAPEYAPSGYKQGRAEVNGASVNLNYVSEIDGNSYKLSQEYTTWSSQTLFDNIVSISNGQYQALQENGLTIYQYDGTNAAWIDGGVLYRLSGDADLNAEEIRAIAASIE